jgi:hypothetical protein
LLKQKNVTSVIKIAVPDGMTYFEKFLECYNAMDYHGCGAAVYEYIDLTCNNGTPLPEELKERFALLVEQLHSSGAAFEDESAVKDLLQGIYNRLVTGPDNPEANN